MKKYILILFALSSFSLQAQFLHFGVRTFYSPVIAITYYEYDINDYVYYFSNERNETIRFGGLDSSSIRSQTVFPDIYMRYNMGNHWFLQLDFFATWFTNEARYKNSVDYADYAGTFNPTSDLANLGYNNIKLRWAFLGNSFTVGYLIRKTKAWRPYIYAGAVSMYLMRLKPGDSYETRDARNTIIFNNLSTFVPTTYHFRGGLGFQYHGFTIDFYAQRNIGEIDRYASNFGKENLALYERPNYKNLYSFNTSLGINLLSFNTSKSKSKNIQ